MKGHLFGNYGTLDNQFALKWVQRNIEKFGGDPDNVTVFGQSAGARNSATEVLSPLARGLFQHAIFESGADTHRNAVEHRRNEGDEFRRRGRLRLRRDVGCHRSMFARLNGRTGRGAVRNAKRREVLR